jgi:hypothetical protein
MNDFCIFILTHGRPNKVYTYDTLRKSGYTGKIYIVIDNEDNSAKQYYKKFGDIVKMFNKTEIAKTFDEADNFNDRRAIVYARNACFEIAEEMGVKYFCEMDDDYKTFNYRIDKYGKYPEKFYKLTNLDDIIKSYLIFYIRSNAMSIAFSQGGDYIGGKENKNCENKLMRKCMNSFFCSTDRKFKFVGRINEDVNTYTWFQSKGNLFLTAPVVSLTQKQTQSNSGGMTDIYLDNGTYVKSFYSVIFSPSCVKVSLMGDKHIRIHHMVSWRNAVPEIISEKYKK